jgi:hypothetical protein
MTQTEPDLACYWCGADDKLELIDIGVKIANPQVDFEHAIHRCGHCGKLMAEARWGKQHYLYRALEYPRSFRAPVYVLVYDVACGWCGRSDMIEPQEINATVGNPASARHQYDIYACHACDRYTAISYLGQVFAYRASQDDRYPTMYYLEIDDS